MSDSPIGSTPRIDRESPGSEYDSTARLQRVASDVLRRCRFTPGESLLLLEDQGTCPEIGDAFASTARASGVEPVVVRLTDRGRAFADLPQSVMGSLLASNLTIDLTSVQWLYSDSWRTYCQSCAAANARLALVWGGLDSLPFLRVPALHMPFETLPLQILARLDAARSVHVMSVGGTDFSGLLGDPEAFPRSFIGTAPTTAGEIGAPLCRSVTAPLVPGSSNGILVFDGVGRIQGPHPSIVRGGRPVVLTIENGMLTRIAGEHPAADTLRAWRDAAPGDDVRVIMDFNIGCDPRLDLAWGDNSTIHSLFGGFMIGIGNPYTWRPEGSERPGYHLDLMLPGVEIALDGRPLLRAGTFV